MPNQYGASQRRAIKFGQMGMTCNWFSTQPWHAVFDSWNSNFTELACSQI